jgi:hypothetical protein
VTYALGIYLLNLLIAFLSPKIDPAIADLEDDDADGMSLPMKASDTEFRPVADFSHNPLVSAASLSSVRGCTLSWKSPNCSA